MRNIKKGDVPDYWLKLLKKHPHLKYTELDPNYITEKSQLKTRMLQEEQYYLCCYCCRSIDYKHSHIEHFRSRDSYPKLEMAYNNMLISCYSGNSCGMQKKNSDFPQSISYEDWERRFAYTVGGFITASDNDPDTESVIRILNLNNQELVKLRRAIYDECIKYAQWMGQDGKEYIRSNYIEATEGHLPRFSPMVEYFFNRGDFDPDTLAAT